MTKLFTQALLMLLLFSALTGIIYPLAVTGAAHLCCARQAEGSILMRAQQAVGSALIGQPFDQPQYFWGRPSATTPQPYNGLASGGSNLGPTNPAQIDAVTMRIAALRQADPDNRSDVPVDLVTASGSGLDPQISLAAAQYQLARVARVRHLPAARVQSLIDAHSEGRQWGVFGEPRVNVLQLNLALDALR